MNKRFRSTPAAVSMASLALALAWPQARADVPPPNDGQRYVSVGGQADNQRNQQVLSTLSLPVGRQAWVQAGVGKSRSDQAAGGYSPGIVTAGAGVAGEALQLTVNASHRSDGNRYSQTDLGSSLDWRHDGNVVGLDLTHRSARAAGTAAVDNGQSGSATVPAQARVSGNGVGLHGSLRATAHVSVYAAVARNRYKTSTQQASPSARSGLLGIDPLLVHSLVGGNSIVNRDEAALDHGAMVGASYRWEKVAVSGEYLTGRVHDSGGTMHGVELKAAVDVAPGWRVSPGVGRGTGDQGGDATFASLSAVYAW